MDDRAAPVILVAHGDDPRMSDEASPPKTETADTTAPEASPGAAPADTKDPSPPPEKPAVETVASAMALARKSLAPVAKGDDDDLRKTVAVNEDLRKTTLAADDVRATTVMRPEDRRKPTVRATLWGHPFIFVKERMHPPASMRPPAPPSKRRGVVVVVLVVGAALALCALLLGLRSLIAG